MTTAIEIPASLKARLQQEADRRNLSISELATAILSTALREKAGAKDPIAHLDDVVSRIRAMPRCAENIRPATASLADALRCAPEETAFDLSEWNRQWAAVESEMRAITVANEIAESRR